MWNHVTVKYINSNYHNVSIHVACVCAAASENCVLKRREHESALAQWGFVWSCSTFACGFYSKEKFPIVLRACVCRVITCECVCASFLKRLSKYAIKEILFQFFLSLRWQGEEFSFYYKSFRLCVWVCIKWTCMI